MVFLFEEVFRSPREELFAWLINIGHGLVDDLLKDLGDRPPNGYHQLSPKNPDQLCLTAVRTDSVALPILERTAALESGVELEGDETAVVRYYRKNCVRPKRFLLCRAEKLP